MDNVDQLAAQQLAKEANAKVLDLCRRSYEKGRAEGYQLGFADGARAVMGTPGVSEILHNKVD